MIEREYTFRYSDIDKNGQIRLSSVMDILQDVAIYHSDTKGYTLEALYSLHIAWLLQGWRIRFLKPLDATKPILVKTGIMNIHKFSSARKSEIWQDGELKSIATADWFTVDTERMRVILVPEQIFKNYESVQEEDNELPFIKLRPEKDVQMLSETHVEKRDLDTNNHMNNVKSAEVAMELLPEDFEVNELQITYRKALLPDETIKMCRKITDNGIWVELKNGNEETCVLLFAKEKKK